MKTRWEARFGGDHPVWSILLRRLSTIELKAYHLADGIVVPCLAALDSYFEFSASARKKFEDIIRSKDVYEVPTGVREIRPTHPRDEVAARLRVPSGRIVVGFFGRYHVHKGFDIFLDLAKLAEHDRRFYFVSGGEGALKAPAGLANYTDLGWLESMYANALNVVDVIIAPNRVTYFDLGLLEAMSLQKPIIASDRGGNRCLARHSKGVALVRNLTPRALYDALTEVVKEGSLTALGKANRLAYNQHYSLSRFAANHLRLAETLLYAKSDSRKITHIASE